MKRYAVSVTMVVEDDRPHDIDPVEDSDIARAVRSGIRLAQVLGYLPSEDDVGVYDVHVMMERVK